MTVLLQVARPEGEIWRILSSAGDYLFRYYEEAKAKIAISLLMPVRLDEYRHRELHPTSQMNLPEGYVLEQLRNRLAQDVLAPDLVGNKSLFASRQGLLEFAKARDVARPEDAIR
jgi:serine/threonine-protein kinase HipA